VSALILGKTPEDLEFFQWRLAKRTGRQACFGTKRPVVNPKWRDLDRRRRSVRSKLTTQQARFAALTLHPESDEKAHAKWERRKAEIVEAIEQYDS
jgi:hypothetical protein